LWSVTFVSAHDRQLAAVSDGPARKIDVRDHRMADLVELDLLTRGSGATP
jgi:hypothetical protein